MRRNCPGVGNKCRIRSYCSAHPLQIRKVSTRGVPHRLRYDLAERCLKVVTYLLSSSDSEGHDFIKNCYNGRKVGEVV